MPAAPHPAPGGALFTMDRHFRAPRQRVWDAFLMPDQFARWFGPRGSTTTVISQDVRPDGLLHYAMDIPGGGRLWGRLRYREIVAPSRLSWISSFADEHGGVIRAPFFDGRFPLEMLTTFVFEDDKAGTRVTLSWMALDASEPENRTVADNTASFLQGWSGSFDQLDQVLA
jgi:uncharacterized protein YndB with AHSA1/START domain